MAGVMATPTLPKAIPNARAPLAQPGHLTIPAPNPTRAHFDALSPVTQNGSFEFDRIVKSGEVLKRTRTTKSWKPVYIVVRPNLLSIYKDKKESKLRHQINLSELTAVARQKDSRRKEKHVFGLFSPSRNYHLSAPSDVEAQEWVECIRREARIDEQEEELYLTSPTGTSATYAGFGRSIDASLMSAGGSAALDEQPTAGYSSSDIESFAPGSSLPRRREQPPSSGTRSRRVSIMEYSGNEHGDFSDLSDSALGPVARMSSLSLAATDGRPSTSSAHGLPPALIASSLPSQTPPRPSGFAPISAQTDKPQPTASTTNPPQGDERVLMHGWIYILNRRSGVRRWVKHWMVLRQKALALYKSDDEYTALRIIPFANIIDAVEIDPISRSKTACMQIISEERNFRCCALDEESLAMWLGAFKSLLAKRKIKSSGGPAGYVPTANAPTSAAVPATAAAPSTSLPSAPSLLSNPPTLSSTREEQE